MNLRIVGKQGKGGRWRWQAQDIDDGDKYVAIPPRRRDWPTKEEAEAAGNAVIFGREQRNFAH